MKRILLYMAALALLLPSGRGTDIGRLQPVEVVWVKEERGILILETDTGARGWGLTVEGAINKMKETTPGRIYLDTADFVLLEENTESYLPQLREYLKNRTRMAYTAKDVDLKEAAGYLRVHKPSRTIGDWVNPGERLTIEAGKMIQKNN